MLLQRIFASLTTSLIQFEYYVVFGIKLVFKICIFSNNSLVFWHSDFFIGGYINLWYAFSFQVAALIVENTFTSILDMAGVLLPFLKWFIGGSGSKGPKILNFLVRSPWSTIDIIGEVRLHFVFNTCMMDIYKPLDCILLFV